MPIRFLPFSVLTAVFPPIEESTWAKSVEGIFIRLTPLLKILATKLPKSPIIPPPTVMIVSFRLRLFLIRLSKRIFAFLNDFNFSLGRNSKTKHLYCLNCFLIFFLKLLGIFLSTISPIFFV